jgi:hypothetical protein
MTTYKYCLVNNSIAYVSEIEMEEWRWREEFAKLNIKIKNAKFSNTPPYMAKLKQLSYTPRNGRG